MRRHWPVFEAYLLRGALCWLATRAVVGTVLFFGSLPALRLSAIGAFEMVALSMGVSVLETYRRRELALLANLAVHPITLGALFALPAVLGEMSVGVVASAVR